MAKGVKIWGLGEKIGGGVSCIRTPTDAFAFSKSERNGHRWCRRFEPGKSLHRVAKTSVCAQSDKQIGERDHDGENERLQEIVRLKVLETASNFSYRLVAQVLCLLLIIHLFLISYHICCVRSPKMTKNYSRNKSVQ